MKRFHVGLSTADLEQSINFYTHLFGSAPTVSKSDYAKWMLDDPRINFSVTASNRNRGINHVGLQVDSMDELAAIQQRLSEAERQTFDQPDAHCCYARSSKTWVRDPDDVAWETFVTHGEITQYGDDREPAGELGEANPEPDRCCAASDSERCCA